MAELTIEQKRALAMAAARKRMKARQSNDPVASSAILPISRYANGDVRFDIKAGLPAAIVNSAVSAFKLPGEVYRGEVDPLSNEGIDRAGELAAFATPVSPAYRPVARTMTGAVKRPKPAIPTYQDLKKTGGRQIEEATSASVEYSSKAVSDMARKLKSDLEASGRLARNNKAVFKTLDDLANPPADSTISISGIRAAKESIDDVAGNFSKRAKQRTAKKVQDALVDFIENPPEGSIVSGSAADAAALHKAGRANYAAGMRGEQIARVERVAKRRTASANSGRNLGNTLKQRTTSMVESPKRVAGFNQDEMAALDKVIFGTGRENSVREWGNRLGGGGGAAQAVIPGGIAGAVGTGVGLMTGSPTAGVMAGAATAGGVGKLGGVLRNASNKMVERNFRLADELVRSRSPLAAEMARLAPMSEPLNPIARAAIARALLAPKPQGGGKLPPKLEREISRLLQQGQQVF